MNNRKTIKDFSGYKNQKDAFVCLTAYTALVARLVDAHADVILVGDSVGMVLYGLPSTLQVTMDMMVAHGAAVVRSTSKALVVVDMPFGSYQESPEQAFRNAARLMAETGCGAVKLEGGAEMASTVSFLAQRGIPVMGHIGLQPQSVNSAGGYKVVGRDLHVWRKVVDDAKVLERAGTFSIVLECVLPELAQEVTQKTSVPIIGIGASADCDGQILVTEDLLGFGASSYVPKFVKQYAALADISDNALKAFAADVRARRFPGEENIYKPAPVKSLKEAGK